MDGPVSFTFRRAGLADAPAVADVARRTIEIAGATIEEVRYRLDL